MPTRLRASSHTRPGLKVFSFICGRVTKQTLHLADAHRKWGCLLLLKTYEKSVALAPEEIQEELLIEDTRAYSPKLQGNKSQDCVAGN